MAKLAPCVKLSNGQQMPVVGLGTYRCYVKEAEQAVKDAIDVGYRHIDTAFVYENERDVGRAIKSKLEEGKIKREDLFVVTKLAGIHHDPKLVEHACRLSLKNLCLDYIDLYLIHFPVGQVYQGDKNVHGNGELSDTDYLDTWKAMEELVDLGLVKGIGLSNFNAEQITRILENCRIRPVVNQVECNPAFNQKKLIQFCREKQIIITAYSPLARPVPDRKWPPFLYDKVAQDLASRYERTSAQICLRYLLQLGCVVIPKSVRRSRIEENFNCCDFQLSDEDMKIMDRYQTDRRLIPFTGMQDHKYFPFNTEF